MNRLIALISWLDRQIERAEVLILSTSVAAMALNSIANVAGRYLFNQGLYFSEELNQFLMVAITFIGLSYVTRKGRHIRMSALYDALNARFKRYLMLLICLCTAAVMFMLAYYAYEYLAKLASRGIGRWGGSSGDRAKFGLTIPQILRLVEKLQAEEMLDCLQLLHYHIGSQLSSISVVKSAIREASQIYVELVKLGAPMGFLDVGGGLAVDYSGSKNNFPSSKNYNMQNYANDVVATVQDTCDETNVPVPVLVSESGRAIASHQAVLIFDVLGSSEVDPILPPKPDYKEHLVLRNLRETYDTITPENYQENYHDAVQFKDEAISLFNLGYLSLGDRANAEELYWSCCQKIFSIIQGQASIPEDFEELWQNMAALYYVNLSVFQSVPDSWAIDQLFPIMPIHRLHEEPTKKGILADLTCDSDGRINRFIDTKAESKNLLELHPPNGQPYYLGLFLMGAYQEIMGNLHNLFGDTHVVHVRLTDDGYHLEHLVEGDTIKEVLQYVQYDVADLLETMRCRTEKALSEKRLTLQQSQLLINHYRQSLESYTYLH